MQKLSLALDLGGYWGQISASDDFKKAWSASRSPGCPKPPPAELEEGKEKDTTAPPRSRAEEASPDYRPTDCPERDI